MISVKVKRGGLGYTHTEKKKTSYKLRISLKSQDLINQARAVDISRPGDLDFQISILT
jgi:hypothetical protein